jgi:hypothetical protein
VVDTVGAGDAFGGAFLAWWAERGLARENLEHSPQLLAAVTAAARVASLTCATAGAEPPWRYELDTDEEWASRSSSDPAAPGSPPGGDPLKSGCSGPTTSPRQGNV